MSKKIKIKEKAKTKAKENGVQPKGNRVCTFRVMIESEEEDVIREIEILDDQTFEDFHDAIKKAYGFTGKQMASFYLSNEDWEKEKEIALMPLEVDSDSEEEVLVMSETQVNQVVKKPKTKLLYIFDFMLMWNFYVELLTFGDTDKKAKYPRCSRKVGKAPSQNSKKLSKLNDDEEDMLKELKGDRKGKDVFSDEIFEGFDDFDEGSGFNDLEDMDGFTELDKF